MSVLPKAFIELTVGVLDVLKVAAASSMLPSAEFICLRVAYREVFWEELSRLIWLECSIRRPLLF